MLFRSVLIQSASCGVPIYHISLYLLPDTNIEKMSKVIRKFFWQGNATKKKYYMVKWNLIMKPKKERRSRFKEFEASKC